MFGFVVQLVKALEHFDTDTKLLFLRFVIRAAQNPSPNEFVKAALQRIFDEMDAPAPARTIHVPAREVKR